MVSDSRGGENIVSAIRETIITTTATDATISRMG
jgi:hypothetical protein